MKQLEIRIKLDDAHNFQKVYLDGRPVAAGGAPCNLEELVFFALNGCLNPVHAPYASEELEQKMETGKKRAADTLLWLFAKCANISRSDL